MTSASLGVSAVVAGGTYLVGHAQDSGRLRVVADPAIGANLSGATRHEASGRAEAADRASRGAARGTKPTPTATPTATPSPTPTEHLLDATGQDVLDRTAVERRRAAEEASRSRARMESGDPRQIARALMSQRGWGSEQFSCLDSIYRRESGWRVSAANPSGAYGIPQAKPGSVMSRFGSDWRTNPKTQLEWGLWYIGHRYGSPCGAWGFWRNNGWY